MFGACGRLAGCMLTPMMSISEMQRLSATVNSTWHSPVADAAATRWGVPAGEATWWRSSGTHVFVLPPKEHRAQRFLRLVSDRHRTHDQVVAVAAFASELARGGIRLAGPVHSSSGLLVESVDTEIGLVHACVIEGAPGDQIEADELTEERADAWGQALAQIHVAGQAIVSDLPNDYAHLQTMRDVIADDAELARVLTRIVDSLAALPTTPDWHGATHGDLELDNMAWVDDVPTCFDFDDAASTWFAADIANAVRDLTTMGRPTSEHRQRFDGFIRGYRGIRDLPTDQLGTLPLQAAAGIARRLVGLRRALVVDTVAGEESESLKTLRQRLEQVAASDRAELLAARI